MVIVVAINYVILHQVDPNLTSDFGKVPFSGDQDFITQSKNIIRSI